MISENDMDTLVAAAREARTHAYAPYSGFCVGAALLCASGKIYTGCNVENVSYGGTICAERSAICAAVTAGERDFRAIAVSSAGKPVTPCGICRQVLAEFSKSGDLTVICAGDAEYKTYVLSALLPDAFDDFQPEVKTYV